MNPAAKPAPTAEERFLNEIGQHVQLEEETKVKELVVHVGVVLGIGSDATPCQNNG